VGMRMFTTICYGLGGILTIYQSFQACTMAGLYGLEVFQVFLWRATHGLKAFVFWIRKQIIVRVNLREGTDVY
jgi:hypothetical protein